MSTIPENTEQVEVVTHYEKRIYDDSVYGRHILYYEEHKKYFESAIINNDLDRVRNILKEGTSPNIILSLYDKTPIIICIKKGYINMMKLLLEYGASVHKNGTNLGSPLRALCYPMGKRKATMTKKLEMLDILLEHGADMNEKDSFCGRTMLHSLASSEWDMSELITKAIEKGADIDIKDDDGHTPLYDACNNPNNYDNFITLIKKGANVNAINNYEMPLLIELLLTDNCIEEDMEYDEDLDDFINTYITKEKLEWAIIDLIDKGANICRGNISKYPAELADRVPDDILRHIQTYAEHDPLDLAIKNEYKTAAGIIAKKRNIDLNKYKI
jgi:ankyrin repeat protein